MTFPIIISGLCVALTVFAAGTWLCAVVAMALGLRYDARDRSTK